MLGVVGSRNGGNYFRDWGIGRIGDGGYMEGGDGLSRWGERFEMVYKNELLKCDSSYKYD